MNKTIPVNNHRLSFGLPLDKIGMDGNLHPGLRALFLKAHLSALSRSHSWGPSPAKIVLQALSSGVDGQGSLSERMSLKERLEEGCSIVDTPAPPGASLWLIRHFIGRLPDPLLRGEHWRQLVSECSVAIQHMHTAERTVCPVHKLIARSLSSIRKEEYLVLAALFNLVHDLSMDRKTGHLNWVAIKSLVQYFTPSLVTRPFIPGLTTEGDCHFHPMMLMTCYYWPEIHLWCYHLDHTSIISSILPSATTPPSKTSWSFHSEIKQHKQGETAMSDINLDVMCLEDSFKSHRENGVGQLMGLVNNSPYIFPHQTHTILEDIPKIECCCSQEGHKHEGLYSRKEDREVETNTNHVIGKRTKTQGTQCGGRYPEKGRDSGLVFTLVHKKAETLVRDCSSQYEDNVSASEDERSRSKDLRKTICDDSKQQNSLRFGLSHMFAVDQLHKKYNSNADGSLCPVQRVKSADKINFHSTKTFVHANKDSKTPNSVTHYDQSEPEMYSPFSEDTKYFSLENLTINSPRSVPTCNSEGKQLFCVKQDHPNRKDKLLISPEEEDFELRIQQKSTIGLETSGNSGGVQIFSDLTESTGRLETSIKPGDDKMVAEFIESAQRLETLRMSKDDQTVTDFIESARLLETLRKTEGNQTVADFIERTRLLETLRKTEGNQTVADFIERARLLEISKKPEGDQTIVDIIERARLLETSRKSVGDQTVTNFIESIKCSSTPSQDKITDGLSIPFDCNQLTTLDNETSVQRENNLFKYTNKKIRNLLSLRKTKKPTENEDLEHNILTDNNLKDEGGKHSELSTKLEDQFFMQSEKKSNRFRFIKTFKRKSRSLPKHYRQWNTPQVSPNLLDSDLDCKNRWGRGRTRLGPLTSVFGSLINLWEHTPFNRGQSFCHEAKDVSVGDLIDLKDESCIILNEGGGSLKTKDK